MSESSEKDRVAALVDELEEVTDDISDVRFYDIPVMVIFGILFFIVALQFFTRYVLNDSLGWTEEIARYFLILLGFIGGVTCVRMGKHIFLEFLYYWLPPRTIKPLVMTSETIVAAFFGYAGWLAIELAERTNSNMVSIALPKSIIYYIVSVACFAMAAFAIVNLVRLARRSADDVAKDKLEHPSEGI